MCRTLGHEGWVVRGQKKLAGRDTAHSLVPEHHTLDAGPEENHAAEVWIALRKLEPHPTVAPVHSPHSTPVIFPATALAC